jgi:hypothetical protein
MPKLLENIVVLTLISLNLALWVALILQIVDYVG